MGGNVQMRFLKRWIRTNLDLALLPAGELKISSADSSRNILPEIPRLIWVLDLHIGDLDLDFRASDIREWSIALFQLRGLCPRPLGHIFSRSRWHRRSSSPRE